MAKDRLFDEEKFWNLIEAWRLSLIPKTGRTDPLMKGAYDLNDFIDQAVLRGISRFAEKTEQRLKDNFSYSDGVLIGQIFCDELAKAEQKLREVGK